MIYCKTIGGMIHTLFQLSGVEWILYAVLSAILAGLMPNFLKSGTRRIAPSFAAFIYNLLYVSFLALTFVMRRDFDFFFAFSKLSIIKMISLGTISAFAYLTYTTALMYGGVAKVIPFLLIRTVISRGIGFYLDSVAPSKLQICSIILLVLGVLLLESGYSRNSRKIWVLFAFISLALFLLSVILTERIWTEYASVKESADFIVSLIGVIILLLVSLLGITFQQPGNISIQNWIYLLLAGLTSGVSIICSAKAALCGPNRFLEPISSLWFPVSMLFARIIHKEEFPVGALFGILIIILGSFGLMII